MHSYQPNPPPSGQTGTWQEAIQAALKYVWAELGRIQQAANAKDDSITLDVLHAAPARVKAGMLVMADGVDWQPDGVNGEGLYRRDKTNASWVFIG